MSNAIIGTVATALTIVLISGGVYLNVATKEWRYEVAGRAMLAQAENEKKVTIEQAKADFESAKYKRLADVERAKGISESNKIINDSLTDRYIRWLYVENIKDTNNQVIYLPTEAGLPILESGRIK